MQPHSNSLGVALAAARFVLETLLVFVAAATPIVLLDGGFGILISAGIVYFYLKKRGDQQGTGSPPAEPDPEFAKFRTYRGRASLLAFVGLSLLPIAAWILWAFPTIAEPDWPAWLSFAGVMSVMVGMLLASLALGWMAVASLRRRGESVGQAYDRVLAGRTWEALRLAIANFAMYLAMLGMVALYSSLTGMIKLLNRMTPSGGLPDSLEVAIAMPAAPIWLYASIVLLALFLRLSSEDPFVGHDGHESTASHRSHPAFACATLALGGAVMLGAMANIIHLAVLSAYGPIAQVGPITAVVVEIDDWLEIQQESGRTSPEIVAEIQGYGRWTPASPDAGLVQLIPTLKTGKTYGAIGESTCSFAIEAGLADIDALSAIDWLPQDEAEQPVTYCLSVDCPSPTRWPDDTTLSLFSSHSSQNRYWIAEFFLDIFATGAVEPGGYCTTAGGVADQFQG